MAKWIVCPRSGCGGRIGRYNEDLEEQRAEDGFKSWCPHCEHAVTPIVEES